MTEALAQHDVTRQLVIDGEEVESGYEDINLEIAIDLSSEFSSRNYQYFYKLTWQDFRLSQILRDTLAELNGDVALARAGVQTNGQVLRLCALPQDHQRVVGKLAFEEVATDDEFMVSLDDFVKTNIATDVIGCAKVREILDRSASRYIDDYEEDTPIAPADSPRCVSKSEQEIIRDLIAKFCSMTTGISDFNDCVASLKSYASSNPQIYDYFVKKINLDFANSTLEMQSLNLMDSLLRDESKEDFEYISLYLC